MDKRIEKTKLAIKNAFMELRAKKPLEKITVKELTDNGWETVNTYYPKSIEDAIDYITTFDYYDENRERKIK